jgi:hypothetical protein
VRVLRANEEIDAVVFLVITAAQHDLIGLLLHDTARHLVEFPLLSGPLAQTLEVQREHRVVLFRLAIVCGTRNQLGLLFYLQACQG